MSTKTEILNLNDNQEMLSMIFSSERYARFVSKFVKSFKNDEYEGEFSFGQSSTATQKVIKNARGYNLGYAPNNFSEEELGLITNKTLNFFIQVGFLSYSRYEVNLCNMKDIIEATLRENNSYASREEISKLAKKSIFILIEDFV